MVFTNEQSSLCGNEEVMNVLMIVSWYTPKGNRELEAGVFHYEQSMDLKKHCNVALYYPFDKQIGERESKAEEWGLLTYRSKYRAGRFFRNKRQMMATMERIVEEFAPDIIHAHCGAGAGYFAIDLAKRFHLPMVITEHTPQEISKVDKKGYNHFLTKKAYAYSQANICVSKDSQAKLGKIFPECSFDVIYNGIVLPHFSLENKRYYRDGFINVAIVAILYDLEVKGMKYLLKAMEILKSSGKKFVLHHIGAGEYLEHFKQMAVELGIDDVCIFYGRCQREKLYEIVGEMDFFVSSSLMECSGVSVQEAMLLGKPILGTNSGGVDSLVPEQAGHIVERGNADALARGMLYMEENLSRYDGEWIRKYAHDSFAIDQISEKYMHLYEEVIGAWGKAGKRDA